MARHQSRTSSIVVMTWAGRKAMMVAKRKTLAGYGCRVRYSGPAIRVVGSGSPAGPADTVTWACAEQRTAAR